MFKQLWSYLILHKKSVIFSLIALSLSLLVGASMLQYGVLGPLLAIAFSVGGVFIFYVLRNARIAFWVYLAYCFVLGLFVKTFYTIPVGLAMDGFLLLIWASILVNANKLNWKLVKNEHVFLALLWFLVSGLQVLNPNAGSVVAWFNELRFVALSWLLIAPLAFLLFNRLKNLNQFIAFILFFSALATLYGVKQLYLGVNTTEQIWLDGGANETHILKGQFRVFSTYSDAGQFGASQAIMAVISLVLATGPFVKRTKLIFFLASLLFLYGMGISGTRGALFGLVAGIGYALFLSKNFKVLIIGSALALSGLATLKYTNVGDDIFQIHRLRTALDPKDESFKVRLVNQNKLQAFLKDMPFGAGLGMSGTNGVTYNADKPIAKIPPDSYWVKVWVMYGVVGLLLWVAINAYLIGKCSGVIWRIKNKKLKVKLVALAAGAFGCFVCSYGNEVMNGMPSLVVLFMSWSFILLGPHLDQEASTNNNI